MSSFIIYLPITTLLLTVYFFLYYILLYFVVDDVTALYLQHGHGIFQYYIVGSFLLILPLPYLFVFVHFIFCWSVLMVCSSFSIRLTQYFVSPSLAIFFGENRVFVQLSSMNVSRFCTALWLLGVLFLSFICFSVGVAQSVLISGNYFYSIFCMIKI